MYASFLTKRMCKDGRILPIEITVAPMRNSEGVVTGACSIVQDVASKQQTEETLKLYERKFKNFVETSEEWLWELDSHYVFTYSNSGVQKIIGQSPENIIGQELFSIFSKETREVYKNQLQSYTVQEKGWVLRIFEWQHENGAVVYSESTAHPIFDKDNKWIGFRGVDRSITDRLTMEKLKDEFISLISHELRTPLTSIHGALGLLKQSNTLDEEAKKLLSISFKNSEKLIQIVDNILVVQKLHLGEVHADVKGISLSEVLQESIQLLEPEALKLKVKIKQENIEDGIYVIADKSLLSHVINNIISNAIKFSLEDGVITVATHSTKDTVSLSVEDCGQGIPKNFQAKIFAPFTQSDSSSARQIGGLGFGLHLCKKIIEAFRGDIVFKSTEGVGSTFYITLRRFHRQ